MDVQSASHKTSKRSVSFPNPSGHRCREIKKVCGASQSTSGCCLWDCAWDDHICGRGWLLWECQGHGLVASRCAVVTRGAPGLRVSLLLSDCCQGFPQRLVLPSSFLPQPWQCWEPQHPPAASLGWVRSWWGCARGGGTVWGLHCADRERAPTCATGKRKGDCCLL